MIRKRGFTLIELLIAMSMMTVLIGAVTSVYAFTVQRLGYSLANYTTQREAEYGLDAIEHIVGVSQTCSQVTIGTNPCLKCTLPANSTDILGDGTQYACSPNAINRRSQERWGNGKRIWFYFAASPGDPTIAGSTLWMATRGDDLTPGAANVVQAFTYLPGNAKTRLDLIQSFGTSAGPNANEDTITIATGSYTNADMAAASSVSTQSSYQPTLSRTPYERGWRF